MGKHIVVSITRLQIGDQIGPQGGPILGWTGPGREKEKQSQGSTTNHPACPWCLVAFHWSQSNSHVGVRSCSFTHISIGWQRGLGRVRSANSMICTCCYWFVSLNQRKSPVVDMIIAVVRVEPNGKCTIETWTPLDMNGVNGSLCGMAWCGVCALGVNRGRVCAGVHPGPSKHGPDEYQDLDLDQTMCDLKDIVNGTVQIDSGCSLVRRQVNPPICICIRF